MRKFRADVERYYELLGEHPPISRTQILLSCFNPRIAPVGVLRLSQWFYNHGFKTVAKIFSIFNVFIFGIEVSPKVEIGGGLFLPHTVGTVIGAERIGSNCTIMQGVTLGAAKPDLSFTATMRPSIGNNVLIGAGAKIIGRVLVGDHAKIGANAVVLKDVPAHFLAVGVPATNLSSKHSHRLYESN